jgi:exodeoxyribonuclease VII large subunit
MPPGMGTARPGTGWCSMGLPCRKRFGLMTDAPPLANVAEFTVSELSAALRREIEDSFGYVRVRGEISGYRGRHSSGHAYFALKDEGAKIEAVVWKTAFMRLRFKPEEGMEVVATGRLTTFPGRSTYQIVIETLAPAGVGALMALLEERKRKLAAEGLFDESRKQRLPFLPDVVGVVTSPTGAVIRDILHRLADRFPRRVLVWPVRVQGDGAAEQVAAAIRGFNALPTSGAIPRPDLLIVARGGGSLEDLWSFNEECVVRAVAEGTIPLISAVGHETDVTLIDFVSDRRAPTPTAAAEIAVPVRSELIAQIATLGRRQAHCWLRAMEARRTELRAAARALPSAQALLAERWQKLDSLGERLPRALRANAQIHHTCFSRVAGRMTVQTLRSRIARDGERVDALIARARRGLQVHGDRRRERFLALSARLEAGRRANAEAHRGRIRREQERVAALMERAGRAARRVIEVRAATLARAGQVLNALSYHGVLQRGFALVRGPEGRPLRAAAGVAPGSRLDIEFADGRIGAVADGAAAAVPSPAPAAAPTPTTTAARPRARRESGDPSQGSLFDA